MANPSRIHKSNWGRWGRNKNGEDQNRENESSFLIGEDGGGTKMDEVAGIYTGFNDWVESIQAALFFLTSPQPSPMFSTPSASYTHTIRASASG